MAGIRIVNTAEIIENARLKAAEMGTLNNSFTQGAGNIAGFIGENAVKAFLHIPLTCDQNTYDYDLIWQGMRIDVKSKPTSVIPRRSDEASVAETSRHQRCTHYVFTRLYYPLGLRIGDPSHTYIMGFISRDEYFAKAYRREQGHVDHSNGQPAKVACWNLAHSKLKPITFMVRTLVPTT